MKNFTRKLLLLLIIFVFVFSAIPKRADAHNCLYFGCSPNTVCGTGNCCAIDWNTVMAYSCWCYIVGWYLWVPITYCDEAWNGPVKQCSSDNGWYCISDTKREYRWYECSGTLCGTTGAGIHDWATCIKKVTSTENCSDKNGWYNVGDSYYCCDDASTICTCQEQEYREYYCDNSAGANKAECKYSTTDTRTVKINCVSCGKSSIVCSESCSGTKLVEYDSDCIQESFEAFCNKKCVDGVCQDCTPFCGSLDAHCCKGVCGAQCAIDSDCPADVWTDEYRCSDNQLERKKHYWSCSDECLCYDYYEWEVWETCEYGCNLTTLRCNSPPSAINLSVTQGDYCFASYPPIILSWEFSDPDSGDSQSAYQIQVDNNPDFSSPEIDPGKVNSSSTSYGSFSLSYNTKYYWRVKVWDNYDAESSWTEGPSFTTASHPYPETDFSWTPQYPRAKEQIQFQDQTTYNDGATSWSWDFGDGSTSTEQNPTHSFSSKGLYTVTFTACDDIGCCSKEKQIQIFLPLPKWKEIIPF